MCETLRLTRRLPDGRRSARGAPGSNWEDASTQPPPSPLPLQPREGTESGWTWGERARAARRGTRGAESGRESRDTAMSLRGASTTVAMLFRLHFGHSHAKMAPVMRPKATPSSAFMSMARRLFWNHRSLGKLAKQ